MGAGERQGRSAVVIRPAFSQDAADVARCHIRCWQEAYAGLLSADYLNGLDAQLEPRTQRWQASITEGGPQVAVAVAVGAEGEIVGFAIVGPGEEDDLDITLTLHAIYVRRAHWSTGLGARLLDATLGARDACLWVFEDNTRSCRFYVRNGFVPDGKSLVEEPFGLVEIRMVRRS